MSTTKIKICGLTNYKDAQAAATAGADYLGFILNFSSSPRQVDSGEARKIISKIKLDFPNIKCVGVFVDQEFLVVKNLVKQIGLDVAQLHGSESPEYCAALDSTAEAWKALIIKTAADVARAARYRGVANKILFDAGRGSGKQVDWQLLKNVKVDVLSGGLNPENIVGAITGVHPGIVDLNSGVESAPGKKDIKKIQAAIAAVKS